MSQWFESNDLDHLVIVVMPAEQPEMIQPSESPRDLKTEALHFLS